ncbi:hypothetical protein FOJ82_01080 [Tessaracoccus rhinocerotis]|uniref:Uncharacterized protein n=1 Tax=Tessaracoccus rhinocerotis TaxID=1689449 RepID=A0A553K4A2_9ACTN|nr:hypothetical protein [Tessaracoccus rhinocerotis]TRY19527.1 hypothetical protein FOJ82_01080 [Tessaracoccus rhinocerotis]
MVGKLIKHEAIRTRGMLATVFGAATLLAVMGALLAATQWPVVAQFGLVVSVLGAVGVVPATQLALAFDYWQTGYRRIGYFTQTLPVKGSTIYWAKLAWGTLVVVASVALALLLGAITFMGNAGSLGHAPLDLFSMVGQWWTDMAAVMPWWGWMAAPPALLLLATFNLLQYYFAASVGSEKRFGSLGLGGPVLVWFVLYVVLQIVLIGFMLIPIGLGVEGGALALVSENYLAMVLDGADPATVPIGFLPGFLVAAAVLVWRTVVSWNGKVSLV